MLSTVEILLMPACFALLFLLMLLYWGQTAFFSFIKYKKLTSFVFYLSLFSVTVLLLLRWIDSGHLPLSNLYESLLFLSWSFLSIQAILQINNISNGASKNKENIKPLREIESEKQELLDFIAVIFSPMSLLTYTFAFFNLPKEMQKATALVPALESNWLMMHVSVMILSYAALISGCLLAITYLLFNSMANSASLGSQGSQQTLETKLLEKPAGYPRRGSARPADFSDLLPSKRYPCEKQSFGINYLDSTGITLSSVNETTEVNSISTSKLALSTEEKLDNYSYRLIGVGFPLLTIGILSGAVWANSAWGSYWSWDPKETWALITWLFFAIYLHARITRGWSGKKAAIIATIAFFVVWFCFLGVNLLGTGLHSYGWFKN